MTTDPIRDAEAPPADETRLVGPATPSASAAPSAPAAPAEDGPSLAPGTVVLHTYRITRLIGRGGMGEIYQAEHCDQRTLHAIKIIRPDLAGDELIVSLFLREAGALRKIRHAAIVSYDGLFRDATGRLHLVMEYVDGPSLRDRLRQGPLAPHEIAQLRDRLAAGLAEAHDKGIYHRDLSPDNVILEHGLLERAKLIDFGIARFADPSMRDPGRQPLSPASSPGHRRSRSGCSAHRSTDGPTSTAWASSSPPPRAAGRWRWARP